MTIKRLSLKDEYFEAFEDAVSEVIDNLQDLLDSLVLLRSCCPTQKRLTAEDKQ